MADIARLDYYSKVNKNWIEGNIALTFTTETQWGQMRQVELSLLCLV